MNNTVNFSIEQTKKTMQNLNSLRRNIMNGCYDLREIYNEYSLETWNGNTRKDYHLKMFGADGESGLTGEVLNVCSALNELLYSFGLHIINVYNADGQSSLSSEDFVNSSVTVNKQEVTIPYNSIDPNIIITPSDNFGLFRNRTWTAAQDYIQYNINDFAETLSQLHYSIRDESVNQINNQVSVLNELSGNIISVISTLMAEIEHLGTTAKSSMDTVMQEQQSVTNKMSGQN